MTHETPLQILSEDEAVRWEFYWPMCSVWGRLRDEWDGHLPSLILPLRRELRITNACSQSLLLQLAQTAPSPSLNKNLESQNLISNKHIHTLTSIQTHTPLCTTQKHNQEQKLNEHERCSASWNPPQLSILPLIMYFTNSFCIVTGIHMHTCIKTNVLYILWLWFWITLPCASNGTQFVSVLYWWRSVPQNAIFNYYLT